MSADSQKFDYIVVQFLPYNKEVKSYVCLYTVFSFTFEPVGLVRHKWQCTSIFQQVDYFLRLFFFDSQTFDIPLKCFCDSNFVRGLTI